MPKPIFYMSLINYLKSRVFIAQVLSVIVIVAVLSFLFFHWLTFVTHHGEEITVPNLTKLTPEQAEELLDELDLDYEIIDTVDYQPTIPKLAIVQQEPTAGSKVKGGRTIYIKLNAPTYKMVSVPDLIDRTYRQAVPNLKAVGLLEGSKRYLPSIAKDMVMEMWQNGKKLKPGDKVLKASRIDLVLGDGKIVLKEEDVDSIVNETEQIKDELNTPAVDSIKNE